MKHIKPLGKRDGVDTIWVTYYYSAPHAHNIFLHMAGEFGWVISLGFIAVVLLAYNTMCWGLGGKKQGSRYFQMLMLGGFTTVLVGFGMLEIDWIYGQIPFTMFFVMQYLIYHQLTPEKEKIQEEFAADIIVEDADNQAVNVEAD